MDTTYAVRLKKYEMALRGFFLKALRLQIKPYKDFYISNGYLGSPSILISPEPLLGAYVDSYRYISNAEMYPEWKRQLIDYKSSKKDISIDDGFLVISETLKMFFLQAGLTNYNKIRDELTSTMVEQIESLVIKARLSGSTDSEIFLALSTVFEEKLRQRASLISQTEAHTIMSLVKRQTAMTFFNQKGVVGYHGWLTRNDEKVRHTHVEVNERVLPVDVKYVLNKKRGGIEFAEYPGDINLSAENRVNCRCMEQYSSNPDIFNKKGGN